MHQFKRNFLISGIFLFLLLVNAAISAQSLLTVKYVVDGDTVTLSNGQKVRLLGINTPEINHQNNELSEVGAEEAKVWLLNKVLGKLVWLERSVDHYDKYGRTLAFLINSKGQNINLMLVEKGLASINIYPPNTLYSKQLIQAQQIAEENARGIWGNSFYQVKNAKLIRNLKIKGWGRYHAKILRIENSTKGYKLWLEKKVYIWVANKNLPWFADIDQYQGKDIEVRGWVRKWGANWSINVRHPSQIILLTDN